MAPKAPQQSRAIRTREKLMAALERLLRSQEFEMISVQDIAKEAGVAVGSVYSHFKDKTAFLEALLAYWREQVTARLKTAEEQDAAAAFRAMGSLRTALFEITRAVHAQTLENAHILRAVHTYARLHPDLKEDDWAALVVRSFQPIADLLTIYEDEISIKDHTRATSMLGVFFNTIFIRAALMPSDALIEAANLDDESLIEEVTDMALAYLTLRRD